MLSKGVLTAVLFLAPQWKTNKREKAGSKNKYFLKKSIKLQSLGMGGLWNTVLNSQIILVPHCDLIYIACSFYTVPIHNSKTLEWTESSKLKNAGSLEWCRHCIKADSWQHPGDCLQHCLANPSKRGQTQVHSPGLLKVGPRHKKKEVIKK